MTYIDRIYPIQRPVLHVGFSGTRFGMKDPQKVTLGKIMTDIIAWSHFIGSEVHIHHGDCVGADDEFHHICRALDVDRIIIHPPNVDSHRALCEADESRDPYPHLQRNARIVQEAKVMITAPPTEIEQARGGTWSTTRIARDAGKLWRCVLPSGIAIPGPSAWDNIAQAAGL